MTGNWHGSKTNAGDPPRTTPGPTKKVLDLYRTMPKALSAVLVQMRTEKIGLCLFLYQRRAPGIMDGFCDCRRGLQMVKHIPLGCPRHTYLRGSILAMLLGVAITHCTGRPRAVGLEHRLLRVESDRPRAPRRTCTPGCNHAAFLQWLSATGSLKT